MCLRVVLGSIMSSINPKIKQLRHAILYYTQLVVGAHIHMHPYAHTHAHTHFWLQLGMEYKEFPHIQIHKQLRSKITHVQVFTII